MSEEHARATSSGKTSVGAGLYKLATYLGQSDEEANTKVVFQGKDHQLTVIATKAIAKDDEIKASYTLPVPGAAKSDSTSDEKPETAAATQPSEETLETTVSSEEKVELSEEKQQVPPAEQQTAE